MQPEKRWLVLLQVIEDQGVMSVSHVGTGQRAATNAKEKPLLLAIIASLVLVSTMLFPERGYVGRQPLAGRRRSYALPIGCAYSFLIPNLAISS